MKRKLGAQGWVRMRWLLADGGCLGQPRSHYSRPQECLQSFPKGSSGPQSKGPSQRQAGSYPLVPRSLLVGDVRKTGMGPFPNIKVPFRQQHVEVGQLGLKPHETQHLAPDSCLLYPRPGFNKHGTDDSIKLFWPDPSSLGYSMSWLYSPGKLEEPAE